MPNLPFRRKGRTTLGAKQLAEVLCVSRATVQRLAKAGRFRARKEDARWVFDESEVRKHVRERLESEADCVIPLSVDQFRAATGSEPSCSRNRAFLKGSREEFTERELRAVAGSLVGYLSNRDLTHTTDSWQDYMLHQSTKQKALKMLVQKKIDETGQPPFVAYLNVMYKNLPPFELSPEQLSAIENLRSEDRDPEVFRTTLHDILSESGIDLDQLVPTDHGSASEHARKKLAGIDRERLVRIAESVVAGLLGAGAFTAIGWALENVPKTFAPYSEAQIHEIEGVLYRGSGDWMPKLLSDLEEEQLKPDEAAFLADFFVHGTVLLAFYGRTLQRNPLMREEAREGDSVLDDLIREQPNQRA